MAVVNGNNSNNNLTGTNSSDTISGFGGADTLSGLGSADTLYGGNGNDLYYGGDGNDLLVEGEISETGNDTMYGGNGDDRVYGGQGFDELYGEAGNDLVVGGSSADSLFGGADNDTVSGGDGRDTITGGTGNDSLQGGDGTGGSTADIGDLIYGEEGDDRIFGEEGADTLYGGTGNDYIQGHGGNGLDGDDEIYGGDGIDTIYGENADDTIYGGNDGDSLFGGAGDDSVFGDAGNDTINVGSGFDYVDGGSGDDRIVGSATDTGDDTLIGGDGNDTILSVAGDDEIYGGAGIDNLDGGAGNDLMFGGDQNDNVDGADGNDTVYGDAGADSVVGGAGSDLLYGGTGNDRMFDEDGDDVSYGGDGADNFEAALGNDSLFGDADADVFNVSNVSGNDTITGGEATTATGGTSGGAGRDFDSVNFAGVTTSGVDVTFSANEAGTGSFGSTTVQFSEIEQVSLTQQDDNLDASVTTAAVQGFGNGGEDTMTGGGGNDTLTGGDGNDVLQGGAGSDVLRGDYFNPAFPGTETGNDTLDGGGGGDDTLWGGAANDTFVVSGSTGDSIFLADFGAGETAGANGSSTDNDFVDLTQWYNETTLADYNSANGTSFAFATAALEHDAQDGELSFIAAQGGPTVTFNLAGSGAMDTEHTGVTCFARGTMIEVEDGSVAIEDLVVGGLVTTLDHGPQHIRWIGSRRVSADEMRANPKLRPVRIQAGALARGLPERDVLVSPQHRVLVRSKIAERMYGQREALVAAKHLLDMPGIEIATDVDNVEYFHLLFDRHQIVFADGAPMESLYTGREALKMVSPEARQEIFQILPELADMDPDSILEPARLLAVGRMARKLSSRHKMNDVPLLG